MAGSKTAPWFFAEAHLRHAKADTAANEYMQVLPESVKQMVDSMYQELMTTPQLAKVS